MGSKFLKIIKDKCKGCGKCSNCFGKEAIKIIDGKAEIIESSQSCKRVADCLDKCPTGALVVEERSEESLADQKQDKVIYLNLEGRTSSVSKHRSCAQAEELAETNEVQDRTLGVEQWPIKLDFLPPQAPYFEEANLVIMADCVPAVYRNYREQLLQENIIALGCPKLADKEQYIKKLANIFWNNDLASITIAHLELPCCKGLVEIVKTAIKEVGVCLPQKIIEIGVNGEQIDN